ncbi:hypothetical protein CYY_000590 [Polysphondylium violaceum]|uniref:RING-type E3 ubiquitin transferase n=1 Tax=Polysphondylium violaceum TaxID=133409 RepID=A0A8J4VBE6_9MYCE|nr:hypothetical protein CYY_000590 [Polysphondylium violaceum]
MMSTTETKAFQWCWNPETTEPKLSEDKLKLVDSGEGKAWTSSIGTSIAHPPNTMAYFEIKIDFCNILNSIKIVFGIMSEKYLKKVVDLKRGSLGSLRGGSPYGYFDIFGEGTLCYFANGHIVKDAVKIAQVEPYTTNDNIGMLVDLNTKSVAFFKNQQLQKAFYNIFSHFLSPESKFIYPAISLIKNNSISIVQNPITPTFQFDSILHSFENLSLNNSNSNKEKDKEKEISPTKKPLPQIPNVNNNNNNNSNQQQSTTSTSTTSTNLKTSSGISSSNSKPIIETTKTTTTTTNNNGSNNNNVSCPVCGLTFPGKDMNFVNLHIDECLTYSLLDTEQDGGNEKVKTNTVKCPYSRCKKSIPTKEFNRHCTETHLLENSHNHKCPICGEKTGNLISHLSKSHQPVQTVRHVGVRYSVSTLEADIDDKECAICFDDFKEGQAVARLECWCVFHLNCVSGYIDDKKVCPVHN